MTEKEIYALKEELTDITRQMDILQKAMSEKKALLEKAETENKAGNSAGKGFNVAVKFASGDSVYIYKTFLHGLSVGNIVLVHQRSGLNIAAVVGVSKELVDVFSGAPMVEAVEYDISPSDITPRMREDYKKLKAAMSAPSFFDISIPAEPTEKDTLAVSVRFINNNPNRQEYTYLTAVEDFKEGDILIVPVGVFNLPGRAVFVRYVPFPVDNSIKYKKVLHKLGGNERPAV